MKRMIKDVGKLMEKLKSLRKGGKDKDQSEEKEAEPKKNETEKQEVKAQGNDKAESQTMKNDPEFIKEVDENKEGLKQIKLKETGEETFTPSQTPSMDSEGDDNESFRGKTPWNEIDYQEPDMGNESDSDSFDLEEEGMEI